MNSPKGVKPGVLFRKKTTYIHLYYFCIMKFSLCTICLRLFTYAYMYIVDPQYLYSSPGSYGRLAQHIHDIGSLNNKNII